MIANNDAGVSCCCFGVVGVFSSVGLWVKKDVEVDIRQRRVINFLACGIGISEARLGLGLGLG